MGAPQLGVDGGVGAAVQEGPRERASLFGGCG